MVYVLNQVYICPRKYTEKGNTHASQNGTLTYEKRLRKLKLPTLVYRKIRGDMIEVFKMLHGFYDTKASPSLSIRSLESLMDLRDHDLTLTVCRSN